MNPWTEVFERSHNFRNLSPPEQARAVVKWLATASMSEIDAFEKSYPGTLDKIHEQLVVAVGGEEAIDQAATEREEAIAELGRLEKEFHLAPQVVKGRHAGSVPMFWAWRVFLFAQQHGLEVPDAVQAAIDKHIANEAERTMDKGGHLLVEESRRALRQWHKDQADTRLQEMVGEGKDKCAVYNCAISLADSLEEERLALAAEWLEQMKTGKIDDFLAAHLEAALTGEADAYLKDLSAGKSVSATRARTFVKVLLEIFELLPAPEPETLTRRHYAAKSGEGDISTHN